MNIKVNHSMMRYFATPLIWSYGKAISQIWDNFDIYPLNEYHHLSKVDYYLLALISVVELRASNAITEETRCKRATYIIIT